MGENGKEPSTWERTKAHTAEAAAASLSHNRAAKQGPPAAPPPALRLSPALGCPLPAPRSPSAASRGQDRVPTAAQVVLAPRSARPRTSSQPSPGPAELGHLTQGEHGLPYTFRQVIGDHTATALPETDVRKEDSRQKRERGGVLASQVGSSSQTETVRQHPKGSTARSAHLGLGHGRVRCPCHPFLLTSRHPSASCSPSVTHCRPGPGPRPPGPHSHHSEVSTGVFQQLPRDEQTDLER